MGCLPYFKFFPRDWLADTTDLTLEEQGAYMRFLAWSWKKERPLPLAVADRARILGVSPRKLRGVWVALAEHWAEDADGFYNHRLEDERARALSRSATAQKAAAERWAHANGHANAQADADANA